MIEDIRVIRKWEWRTRDGKTWRHEWGYAIEVMIGGEWRPIREEWRQERDPGPSAVEVIG